jgi:23S rRNA (guanosine2251-2'-O)-methyltransferase
LNRENQSLNLLKKVHVFYKSRKELDNLCGKDEISHQGLIAEVEHLDEITLKEFVYNNNKKRINFIALEDVTDPRNIGSIIRSAVSFGIDGLIVKERSFPSKSKLLYRSASGGIEHMKIFKVSNINTALKYLKTKDFWVSAFDVSASKNFVEHDWNGRNVLLFGSEGDGLKEKTLMHSDFRFKININKNIESLNIANTVSIVSHHITQVKK